MSTEEHQVHLAIGSRYENIDLVQVVVEESLKQLDLDQDTAYWIGMSVREAVANAIQHGNRQDPDKKVEIDFGVYGGEVVIHVLDEGQGFEPARVRDPLAPENRLRPDGRGIFYMKSFMDDIDFSFRPGGGTVVTLRKRIDGPAGQGTSSNGKSQEERP